MDELLMDELMSGEDNDDARLQPVHPEIWGAGARKCKGLVRQLPPVNHDQRSVVPPLFLLYRYLCPDSHPIHDLSSTGACHAIQKHRDNDVMITTQWHC